MNNKQFEGKWDQIKGRIRNEFGKLTEDDVEQVKGSKTRLIGKLKERYGDAKETVTQKLDQVLDDLANAA